MKFVFLTIAGAAVLAAQSPSECQKLVHYGKRAEAKACYTKLTRSQNPAFRAEGFWGIGGYSQANDEFRQAVAAQPKNPEVRVRWGRFFTETQQNYQDAAGLFKEALEIMSDYGPAYLGMALMSAKNFENKAVEAATTAINFDPKLVEAQELLARLALENNETEKAAAEADKALKVSPEALDAMAIHATIDLLANKPSSPWFDKIAAINPVYGRGYELAADLFVLNRRYEEGIAMYRKALELDPDLQTARVDLGVNLMRLGQEQEAYKLLQAVYDSGFHSSETVNTLKLIDSYKRFVTFTTPTTIVRLDRKEADLLRPYIEGELQRAIKTYQDKYGFKLDKPVQVEVYPNHDDFAVRTMGMPGLGALGVTFGNVLAMDSPSGRPPGTFHWASTLWHELSHVYVLSATKHRVPRWFTEGMAVHEETAASPDWGDRLDPEVIRVIKEKKLLPVADLDRGFVRPTYPSQVVVSYFQAGRICDFINDKWGYAKLLAMMREFAESKQTPDVVRSQLKMEPEEFDKQFLAWLDKQVRPTVDGYEEWQKHMKSLAASARSKNNDEVIKEGQQAITIYPDFVEGRSAYELVADAFEAKGDKTNARKQLEQYSQAGGRKPATLMKLAQMQVDAAQPDAAIRTYERLLFVYPMGEDIHKKLGDLYLTAGKKNLAVREFGAAVAAQPTDVAGARFNLAKALYAAQRKEEAKEQLLLSLEVAPGFRPAQKMLLELSR